MVFTEIILLWWKLSYPLPFRVGNEQFDGNRKLQTCMQIAHSLPKENKFFSKHKLLPHSMMYVAYEQQKPSYFFYFKDGGFGSHK